MKLRILIIFFLAIAINESSIAQCKYNTHIDQRSDGIIMTIFFVQDASDLDRTIFFELQGANRSRTLQINAFLLYRDSTKIELIDGDSCYIKIETLLSYNNTVIELTLSRSDIERFGFSFILLESYECSRRFTRIDLPPSSVDYSMTSTGSSLLVDNTNKQIRLVAMPLADSFQITDTRGITRKKGKIEASNTLDIYDLAPGIYNMTVSNVEERIILTKRILIL